MKVVFFGTPEFAVKSLEDLVEFHDVCAVVTQPDKPKGRGKKMVFPPVKEKALEYNIDVLQPGNAKSQEFIDELRKYDADIFVVAAYGQIMTEELLFIPQYGSINVHASLLPKYRGAAPIQRAIIDGCEKTGVTIMQMSKGLDSGDMISKIEIEIEKNDTYGSLSEKLALEGAKLLIETMKEIENGTSKKTKQNDSASTYAHMISKDMGHINWEMTSEEIERQIRGLSPQPGAYTFYKDETLKIWKIEILSKNYEGVCGEIVDIRKNGFAVKTGNGSILVSVLQAKGGKSMAAEAYMRGHSIEKGIILS